MDEAKAMVEVVDSLPTSLKRIVRKITIRSNIPCYNNKNMLDLKGTNNPFL